VKREREREIKEKDSVAPMDGRWYRFHSQETIFDISVKSDENTKMDFLNSALQYDNLNTSKTKSS
jgi:hypothetical protein